LEAEATLAGALGTDAALAAALGAEAALAALAAGFTAELEEAGALGVLAEDAADAAASALNACAEALAQKSTLSKAAVKKERRVCKICCAPEQAYQVRSASFCLTACNCRCAAFRRCARK
jgi:hypothetical protein